MHTLLFIKFIASFNATAQNGAAINSRGAPGDPSAMSDVSSTNSGLLIPRMTTAGHLSFHKTEVSVIA